METPSCWRLASAGSPCGRVSRRSPRSRRDTRSIAVAGTHGKTTTTSMIAVLLERAGLDPSYLIGGDLNESGSGARAGDGDLFVFEADESDGSFLLTRPHVGVVTNVDIDHVDFYPGGRRRDRVGVRRVHDELRSGGGVRRRPRRALGARRDGSRGGALRHRAATTISSSRSTSWDRRARSGAVRDPSGAVAAITTAGRRRAQPAERGGGDRCGRPRRRGACPTQPLRSRSFAGVHRRFEHRGSARGADFFDDYGHTPDRDGGHDRDGTPPQPPARDRAGAAAPVLTRAGALARAGRERRRSRPGARHRRRTGPPRSRSRE